MKDQRPTTHQKAFRLNMDADKYGTIAEIGAGQEVARWFFKVGGCGGDDREEHVRLRHDGE